VKTVLTEIGMDVAGLPSGLEVVRGGRPQLSRLTGSNDLFCVVGSRALASAVADLDLPGLRFVQLTSAGYDGVPVRILRDRGVMVANAGDVYTIPIAESVVYSMLRMARRYHRNPNHTRVRLLRRYNYLSELAGKKVVIVGTGRIGTAVADRLASFDMEVVGYHERRDPGVPYGRLVRTRDELGAELGDASYLVCALPLNSTTEQFVDADLLQSMHPSGIVVNVGRRQTISEDALYRALRAGDLGGAVLDMFEAWPNPVTNRFRRLGNVIVLPGIAAISREVESRLRTLATANVAAVVRGECPEHLIGVS